jgi:hypothetical protein
MSTTILTLVLVKLLEQDKKLGLKVGDKVKARLEFANGIPIYTIKVEGKYHALTRDQVRLEE